MSATSTAIVFCHYRRRQRSRLLRRRRWSEKEGRWMIEDGPRSLRDLSFMIVTQLWTHWVPSPLSQKRSHNLSVLLSALFPSADVIYECLPTSAYSIINKRPSGPVTISLGTTIHQGTLTRCLEMLCKTYSTFASNTDFGPGS